MAPSTFPTQATSSRAPLAGNSSDVSQDALEMVQHNRFEHALSSVTIFQSVLSGFRQRVLSSLLSRVGSLQRELVRFHGQKNGERTTRMIQNQIFGLIEQIGDFADQLSAVEIAARDPVGMIAAGLAAPTVSPFKVQTALLEAMEAELTAQAATLALSLAQLETA